MYEPYIIRKKFLRSINDNLSNIKKHTRQNLSENYQLARKKGEFNKISNELILYNNPSNLFKLFVRN